jgi:hypothetical protein
LTKTTLEASGPAMVVNVSPTVRMMTADIVRSYGSTSADRDRISEAMATSFTVSVPGGCLAVPHRALLAQATLHALPHPGVTLIADALPYL